MNAENLRNAVKNRSLFSNYYLDSLIVEQPQWIDTPDIESDYAAIKELFDTVAPNRAVKPRFPIIARVRVRLQPRQTHTPARPHSEHRRAD